MEIFFNHTRNRYELSCSFEERDQAKCLGFKWCPEFNVWFARDWYAAWKAYLKVDTAHRKKPELEKFSRNLELSYSTSFGIFEKKHLKDFQNAGVEELLCRKGFNLLADEQGLGKTIQVLEFAKFAIKNSQTRFVKPNKVLVIAPSSLKINWQREAKKFDSEDIFKIEILRGTKAKIENPDTNLVIVNYDLLSSGIVFDQLEKYNADLVLGDEIHLTKSPNAARTKRTFSIAKKAKKFIAISGTPIPNRPIEIFPLLKTFCPEALGHYADQRRFEYHFCAGFQDKWGFNNSGASNLEELGERLRATCMIRRLKKDVLGNNKMPPQILAFEADATTMALTLKEHELAAEFLKKNKEIPNIGEIAEIRQELAMRKLPLAIQFIKDLLLCNNKVVVFAHHRAVIAELLSNFAENSVAIMGGLSEKQKQNAVDCFQNDPSIQVFIGQIQAAGVGITLTAASQVVFVESAWSPGDIDQCVDRCDRIGQTKWVQARFLVIEDSLEEHMLKVAFDKAKNINKIMG
jgi:SWI/SNF-related matrix-associated actin-dependent regulator 1 of chromatin subfamily A